jgi:hypothetical protein
MEENWSGLQWETIVIYAYGKQASGSSHLTSFLMTVSSDFSAFIENVQEGLW